MTRIVTHTVDPDHSFDHFLKIIIIVIIIHRVTIMIIIITHTVDLTYWSILNKAAKHQLTYWDAEQSFSYRGISVVPSPPEPKNPP